MKHEKPDLKTWNSLVELLTAGDGKPDYTLAAMMTGLPRSAVVRAWSKGWPGNKRGKGTLPPIKDLRRQMQVSAEAQRHLLEDSMNAEQMRAIDAAVAAGASRRAMESVVSGAFLRVVDQQMQQAMSLVDASRPMVKVIENHMRTQAENPKLSFAEAKGAVAFVTQYVRETGNLLQTYKSLEEVRKPLTEAELSSKGRGDAKPATELMDEMLNLLQGFAAITNPKPYIPKVIDVGTKATVRSALTAPTVTAEGAQSSSSSSSSPSNESSSSSNESSSSS